MSHIKFAGLASEWKSEYAKAYADMLHEIGFCAKAISVGKEIVAYSHKSFTRTEAEITLNDLLCQTKEGYCLEDEEKHL